MHENADFKLLIKPLVQIVRSVVYKKWETYDSLFICRFLCTTHLSKWSIFSENWSISQNFKLKISQERTMLCTYGELSGSISYIFSFKISKWQELMGWPILMIRISFENLGWSFCSKNWILQFKFFRSSNDTRINCNRLNVQKVICFYKNCIFWFWYNARVQEIRKKNYFTFTETEFYAAFLCPTIRKCISCW